MASLPRRGHPYPTSRRALLLPAAAARPTARRRRPATCVPGSRPAPRFEPGGAASNGRLLTRPVARCAPSPVVCGWRSPHHAKPAARPRRARTRRAAKAAVPPAWPPNAHARPIRSPLCVSPAPVSPAPRIEGAVLNEPARPERPYTTHRQAHPPARPAPCVCMRRLRRACVRGRGGGVGVAWRRVAGRDCAWCGGVVSAVSLLTSR